MAMEPSNPVAGDDGGGWSDGENEPGDSGLPMAGGDINNPAACLIKGVADGLAGGVMGSVFGFGSGLIKKQGFKGALREGGTSAKTFALLSGVHSLVSCALKKLRGKEDAWNAGIAGCATGLALSTPGTPQALAQSCLSFGAFSFILDYMNHPRAALAANSHSGPNQMPVVNINMNFHFSLPSLPPFTLPPLLFTHPLTFQQLKPRSHLLGHQQQLHNDGATL
ncbi:hypothetical protein CY35_15G066600 [Sphagnum magellanicum]|nr:hypothetical protein CY35_15G066600 [Sphagnum magellanicum]